MIRRIFVMSQWLVLSCQAPVLGEPQAEATALECFEVVTCLQNAIDLETFDVERDARVIIHINNSTEVVSCEQIVVDTSLGGQSGAVDGEAATIASANDPTECLLRNDPNDGVVFVSFEPIDVCAGAEISFLDVRPPENSLVCIEYVVALE